jgi:pimeloyl-ACP methyl ester carboxylesterase
MPTSAINGVQLYWELSGSGEPAVLVHGSWGDHHNWRFVVPALSNTLRVATYDRRGHSQSERPPGPGSIQEDVADLAGLIEDLFGGPAHVVGNSLGAAIVLRLAASRPELIRSLVVHEPPLLGLLEGSSEAQPVLTAMQNRIAAVVALLQAGDMAGGAQCFVETVAFGPGAWAQLPQATQEIFIFNAPTWLDEIQEPGSTTIALDSLSAFSGPSLLSLGGQSPPFFAMVAERLAPALPCVARHTFAQAGHVPHMSHPEEYIRVVGDFIRGTAIPRAASAA